jgi:hypothetical protein
MIESIVKESNSSNFQKSMIHIKGLRSTSKSLFSQPLNQSASLVLIDRWEDLFTPLVAAGNPQSIAHRVLNTLKIPSVKSDVNDSVQSKDIDIHLTPKWLNNIQSEYQVDSDQPKETSAQKFSLPLSAVATLGFKTIPSLCYRSSDLEDTLSMRFKLMAATEDEGRTALCDELKRKIAEENGTLPPAKKRGFGAEISALLQSLMEASGSDSGSSKGESQINAVVCSRSDSLISLASAVIDAMQRSSPKQFIQLTDWKSSFDERIQRDIELLTNLAKYDDFDATVASLMKYFLKGVQNTSTSAKIKGPDEDSTQNTKNQLKAKVSRTKSAGKEMLDEEKQEPVDVVHLIIMIIR